MALDIIGICNEALAEVPATAISSFDEVSPEAEWCARRYGPALAYLLEMHDWKFPVVREPLAPVANDRPNEWRFAYRVPGNSAAELRIFPAAEISQPVSVPILAGQILGPTIAYLNATQWLGYCYLLAGDVLYTNVEEAVLEFIRNDPNESGFPALFAHALSLELASRLVMPIKKDRARQGDLIKMAENARDRAIADARNRDPSEARWGQFESEVQLARDGYGPGGLYGGLWEAR